MPCCGGIGFLDKVRGNSAVVLRSWFGIVSFNRVSGDSAAALQGDRISR